MSKNVTSRFSPAIGILIAPLLIILAMLLSTAAPAQAASESTCAAYGTLRYGILKSSLYRFL